MKKKISIPAPSASAISDSFSEGGTADMLSGSEDQSGTMSDSSSISASILSSLSPDKKKTQLLSVSLLTLGFCATMFTCYLIFKKVKSLQQEVTALKSSDTGLTEADVAEISSMHLQRLLNQPVPVPAPVQQMPPSVQQVPQQMPMPQQQHQQQQQPQQQQSQQQLASPRQSQPVKPNQRSQSAPVISVPLPVPPPQPVPIPLPVQIAMTMSNPSFQVEDVEASPAAQQAAEALDHIMHPEPFTPATIEEIDETEPLPEPVSEPISESARTAETANPETESAQPSMDFDTRPETGDDATLPSQAEHSVVIPIIVETPDSKPVATKKPRAPKKKADTLVVS